MNTGENKLDQRLRRNERLPLLSEAAGLLLLSDDPNAMLPNLYAKIAPALGLDAYFHFLVNDDASALQLASCSGIPDETSRELTRLEFGQTICGKVAANRRAEMAIDIQQSIDPDAQLVRSFGMRSYVCQPLVANDKLFGTLSFGSRSRDCFAPDELEFFEHIAQYVAHAYERVRLICKLSEVNRSKDDFQAILAHELRNQLVPLRYAAETIRLAGGETDGSERLSSILDRHIGHMGRLLDDLIDVRRIALNKLELRRERLDVVDLVQQSLEMLRPQCEHAGQELHVALPKEPIYVHADMTRLAQVFANLLGNACRYTQRGGRISVSVRQCANQVEIRIEDNGIGIAPDLLPKVFDLFTQAQGKQHGSEVGLGIGLSLVKRLAEMHGGTVTAHSDGPDRGSVFVTRLPVMVENT